MLEALKDKGGFGCSFEGRDSHGRPRPISQGPFRLLSSRMVGSCLRGWTLCGARTGGSESRLRHSAVDPIKKDPRASLSHLHARVYPPLATLLTFRSLGVAAIRNIVVDCRLHPGTMFYQGVVFLVVIMAPSIGGSSVPQSERIAWAIGWFARSLQGLAG